MNPKVRRRLMGLGIAAVVVLGLLLGWRLVTRDGIEDSLFASGTVEATESHLGFQAAGRIVDIRVEEGDPVTAGDTLALLDRQELQARRTAAEAQVREARARLRELETGSRSEEIEQARAAVAVARHRSEDAGRDLERTGILFEGGAVSQEAYDKATTMFEVSQSELRRAEESLRLLEAGPRVETIQAQQARLAGVEASLLALDAQLENMTVRAPFGGVVTVRHREPGEIVSPGAPVVTLMDTGDRWVRIYIREDRIGAVKLGQAARITSDTYAERSYEGQVRFIASEAEFTPKSVQTTEERVKLVYAVKVRISGDEGLDLKPGMPADVRITLEPTTTVGSAAAPR